MHLTSGEAKLQSPLGSLLHDRNDKLKQLHVY